MAEIATRELTAARSLGEDVPSPQASGLWSDTGAVLGAQAIGMVTAAGSSIITARLLGPSGQGVFGLATLWVGFFALALPLSAGYGFMYSLGQGKISLSQALSNALAFALLVGAVGVALCFTVSPVWGRHLVPGVPLSYLLIAACGLPAMAFSSTAGLCLTGAGWVKLGARIGALSFLASFALCALLVWGLRLGVLGAVIAALGTSYVNGALILAIAGRRVRIRPAFDIRQIETAARFGLRVHFGFIAQFANYRLDRFLVNFFLGPAAVGVYLIAVTLSELIWCLPGAVGNALYSRTSSARVDSAEVTARAWRLSVPVVAGACLLAALAGPPLIPMVFGRTFAGAGRVLWVLLPGVLALTAGKVVAPYLVGHNRPATGTYAAVSSLIATVVLDLMLIPRWGLVGAGVASSCAYTLAAAVMVGAYTRVPKTTCRGPLAGESAAREVRQGKGRERHGVLAVVRGQAPLADDGGHQLEASGPGPEHYTARYYGPIARRYLMGDGWSLVRVRDIVRAAQFTPGQKVLDAGCGHGTVALEGAKRGARVMALDFSTSSLQMVQYLSHLLGLDSVHTAKASVTAIPFVDRCFHRVVSADLVEHLSPEQVEAFLREARRVLRNDGRLVLYTPNGLLLGGRGSACWRCRENCGELRSYRADPVTDAGERQPSAVKASAVRLGRRLLYGLLGYTSAHRLHRELSLPMVFPAMGTSRMEAAGEEYEHLHVNVMDARSLIALCTRTGFRLRRAYASRTGTVLEMLPYPLNLYWGGHVSLVFAKSHLRGT